MPKRPISVVISTEQKAHFTWDGKGFGRFIPIIKIRQSSIKTRNSTNPTTQNIKELWANFLSSIKSRKTSVSDIEIGHRSSNVALLGNFSMKLGRSIDGDGEKKIILNDPEANKLLGRNYRGEWVYPS